jgi:glutamyl-tRNA reductase
VALLERLAFGPEAVTKLLGDAAACPYVDEVVTLATCNRVEMYVEASKFHGALADITDLVAAHGEVPRDELTPHLYVHYDSRAVAHLYAVASGLDSMVIGEPQILGQLRATLELAQRRGTAGRVLNELVQNALRVGKRVHSETELDRAGHSLVTVALDAAERTLGAPLDADRRALVVGAGSMSALAATTLRRRSLVDIVVANRTFERGARLADTVGGRAVPFSQVPARLADADIVVTCTGSSSAIIDKSMVATHKPVVIVDLALPRDVDQAVRELPGVTVIDLEVIAELQRVEDAAGSEVLDQVRRIVADEVAAYEEQRRAEQVVPTVAALRAKAADVVAAELTRLDSRLPDLDPRARQELRRTVNRVVDKLMHTPTVRVKQFAVQRDGVPYAQALRELFDLDQGVAEVVSTAQLPNEGTTS